MDIAKISSKGQITIPISVRNKLNLKTGDKGFETEEDMQEYMKEIRKEVRGH